MQVPHLKRVAPTKVTQAQSNLSRPTSPVCRTPLIPLRYTRSDLPNLRIFLKLETHQPINSFKIRGALNAIASRSSELETMDSKLVVTASAGNMGQGVAFACSQMECECIVVVPDHAPETKISAIRAYEAHVIKVPYSQWWEIIETSDCTSVLEIGKRPHVFVHPVCDGMVVAGNSTVGTEILEDLEDVDAIFVPYGGGGLSCGIGSAVMNDWEEKTKEDGQCRIKKCLVVSCEPETASPQALSRAMGKITSFERHYEPSFCDGCGGKAVLEPMWELTQEVIDSSLAVPLDAIEGGVWTLHERNKVVAEGAGGITVGAAMFGPLVDLLGEDVKEWKKIVCVVGGGGIDRAKLCEILSKHDSLDALETLSGEWKWKVRGIWSNDGTMADEAPTKKDNEFAASAQQQAITTALKQTQLSVLPEEEILRSLPMHRCIEAARNALVGLSAGTGQMPLRQVTPLPTDEIKQTGFLVTMPSYLDGFAACKLITVYPSNGGTEYGTNQGIVALFNAKNHGELLLLADAGTVTAQRTAAASAVATKTLARNDSRVVSLLGTGEQARSHFVAVLETGLPIREVNLWGRNRAKADLLEKDLRVTLETYNWTNACHRPGEVKLETYSTVQECVRDADVICTLVPSVEPILHGEWVKAGAHINAVGACLPVQRELDGECMARSTLYCDSREACFAEAGDVVLALGEGSIKENHLVGEIGEVLSGKIVGRENERQVTLFKSLGIALEDLTAARAIYESG